MATTTVIQRVRQGDLANLPRLQPGEFGYALDQKRLFIGNRIDTQYGDGTQTQFNFGVDLDDLGNAYTILVDDVAQVEGTHFLVNNYIVNFVDPPSDGASVSLIFNSEILLAQPPEGILDKPKSYKLSQTAIGTYDFYPITVDARKYGDVLIRYSINNESDKRRTGTLAISLDYSAGTFNINDSYTSNDMTALTYRFGGSMSDGVFTLNYTLATAEAEEAVMTWVEENFYVPDFFPSGLDPAAPSLALQPYRYTLGNLEDVDVSAAVDGNTLVYDSAAGVWVAGTVAGGGGTAYDQSLNTTDDVQFNSVTTDSLIITGTGTTDIQSGSDITLNAVNRISVTSPTPFRLANMDTVTRDALAAPINGDVIYNTDTNKFQGYANGAWVDLN